MNGIRWAFGAFFILLAVPACQESKEKRQVNEPCSTNTDCADNICHLGICGSRNANALGETCTGDGECRSFHCASGRCAKGTRSGSDDCLHDEECSSGTCKGGLCGEGPRPDAGGDAGTKDMGRREASIDARADHAIADRVAPDVHVADIKAEQKKDLAKPDVSVPDAAVPDVAPFCGDGKKNGGEQCDKSDLGGAACATQGFAGGVLLCKANCTFDTTGCYKCGDGIINGTEQCDGTQLGGMTCKTLGFDYGTVSCKADCTFDTSLCLKCTNGCLIGGTCHAGGAINPANQCQKCDPASSTTGWTLFAGSGCVTTLAGSQLPPGYLDGPAASARFGDPWDVAVDTTGKVYVADTGNHRIRLISAGQVSTLAGDGNPGFADGPAASASFYEPAGVAVDSVGKVYVGDRMNHRIRVVYGGQVSTLAGGSLGGFADGPAASARFSYPQRVAVDISGKVYVADSNNHRIRVVYAGQVSTLAGDGTVGFADGPAASAKFAVPVGVAVDSAANVYVGDSFNHRIRLISGGQVTTLAGSGTKGQVDGPAAAAQFNYPEGVAADSKGNVYVAGMWDMSIRLIANGQVTTLAGNGLAGNMDGRLAWAQFQYPRGVAVDTPGKIYVADAANNKIRLINP